MSHNSPSHHKTTTTTTTMMTMTTTASLDNDASDNNTNNNEDNEEDTHIATLYLKDSDMLVDEQQQQQQQQVPFTSIIQVLPLMPDYNNAISSSSTSQLDYNINNIILVPSHAVTEITSSSTTTRTNSTTTYSNTNNFGIPSEICYGRPELLSVTVIIPYKKKKRLSSLLSSSSSKDDTFDDILLRDEQEEEQQQQDNNNNNNNNIKMNRVMISYINPNGIFVNSNLEVNDQIISINNISCIGSNGKQVTKLIQKCINNNTSSSSTTNTTKKKYNTITIIVRNKLGDPRIVSTTINRTLLSTISIGIGMKRYDNNNRIPRICYMETNSPLQHSLLNINDRCLYINNVQCHNIDSIRTTIKDILCYSNIITFILQPKGDYSISTVNDTTTNDNNISLFLRRGKQKNRVNSWWKVSKKVYKHNNNNNNTNDQTFEPVKITI